MSTGSEQRLRFDDVQIIVPTFVYSCIKQKDYYKSKRKHTV